MSRHSTPHPSPLLSSSAAAPRLDALHLGASADPPIHVGRVERRLRRDLPTLLLRDQLLFALGIVWLIVATAWLMHAPATLPWAHLLGLPPVFCWLMYSFVRRHRFWGAFLLDFCYFANWLAWLFFLSTHARLLPPLGDAAFPCVFALVTGPLLLANLPWRVSLAFHSPDKMCSVFIHTFAPFAVYAHRWHTEAGLSAGLGGAPGARLFAWPLLAYAVWQAAYMGATEVCCYARALRNEPRQLTSLRWQAASFNRVVALGRSSGSLLHEAAAAVGAAEADGRLESSKWGAKLFFMAAQLVYTVAGLAFAAAAWHWHAAHVALLCGVGLHVIFQGAGFYVRVFASRYLEEAKAAVSAAEGLGAGGSPVFSPSKAAALAAESASDADFSGSVSEESAAWASPRQRKLSRASPPEG